MARPPMTLGTNGNISVRTKNGVVTARTKVRDYDGVIRTVKRTGRSAAAAERALKAALIDR